MSEIELHRKLLGDEGLGRRDARGHVRGGDVLRHPTRHSLLGIRQLLRRPYQPSFLRNLVAFSQVIYHPYP